MTYKIGIIGCGFIAKKRIESIIELADELDLKITSVADINEDSAKKFGEEFNCSYTTNWKDITSDSNIDIIFVCTINNVLAEITNEAIRNKKHVLVEKPAGINKEELQNLVNIHEQNPTVVKVGFNHRFHPLIMDAKKIFQSGDIGELMWIRGVYGQRGRPGFDKEWRANKKIAGGGELLDQGVHIVDLALDYLGPISNINSVSKTSFWKMEVEDNVFLTIQNEKGNIAQLHTSSTEWQNKFQFEIYGTKGALLIEGLQKNYGIMKLRKQILEEESWKEKYFRYERTERTAPEKDYSWQNELKELISAIKEKREPEGNLYDALETMKVVDQVYNSTKEEKKMEIYADTADLNELEELKKLGVIDGCTTNPIIIAKTGNTDYETHIKKILRMIDGPVSVEVTSNDPDEMVEQARKFAAWGDNVVIKIPIGNAGLQATARLTKLGIKTNVTACMTARQAIIAAKAGATYASIFWARIEDMGHSAFTEVNDAVEVLERHGLKTKIIIGSFRQLSHLNEGLKSGAHVLTIPTKLLKQLAVHPRSESTIQEFLDQWDEFMGSKKDSVSMDFSERSLNERPEISAEVLMKSVRR